MEALIAFEAAARHLSFTRSAEELALTQSAVGRQIALLESFIGVPLFSRLKKRLRLTEVGEMYARNIRESLDRIERDTLAAMAHRGAGGILELAVIPTFATRWLIPRLPDFYRQNPGITLNLTTRSEPFMFTDTPFDAAIHFGNPTWPGTVALNLFGEEITPVCSPSLVAGRNELSPADLSDFTLLHQSSRPEAWRQWLSIAGADEEDCMRGQRYELFSMLVEAARAGLGIALVPRFFVTHELMTEELVAPFDIALKNDKAYFLVYPESKRGIPALGAFERWLLEAARHYCEGGGVHLEE
ncbi:LysR substrate-binding domain-containing protein [Noviherbaspirillum sp.]|uniref:LysR substrate-binding domain-containing protein n=1 Tax=Noviherbaspirillum sp. TaxID=1926288 RepID=UPI002B47740C|nr:LysR substrate-binding domain-containing protein [Noviherbaspirillum sp.]